jgi:hypothetical protein
MFDKIGLGQWFRYVTGSLEVVGALLLLVPRTSAIGGLAARGGHDRCDRHASFHHRWQSNSSSRPISAGNHGWLESIETVRNALGRRYNAELFHSELESGAVETEARSCSIRSRKFPFSLFKHSQNVSPFGFFKCLARRSDRRC